MSASFGEMLMDRRRQMGLSIQQVANTIKMRPQIIEFFETCNYEAMPPRGYAQGMISSYARYLGLNPREVVDAYFDGLYRYENASGQANSGRALMPAMDASSRSANATGRFLMVDSRGAGSRFAQRPPQAGYVPESRSPHEVQEVSRLRPGAPRRFGPQGPSQTSRMSQAGPHRAQGRGSELARGRGPQGYPPRSGARAGYGGGMPPRRSGGGGTYAGGRGRGRNVPQGFDLSVLLADRRFIMGCLAVIAALLILVIFLLFRGCTGGAPTGGSTSKPTATAGSTLPADDDSSQPAPSAEPSDEPTVTAGAGANGEPTEPLPTEYKVVITYTGSGTAWLEVKVNGVYDSEIGTVTEGFSKEYTVTDSIEIMTNNPSEIEVTRDGERVKYDSKSSGIGRITLTVPKPPEPEPGTEGGADAADGSADGDGTDGNTEE